MKRRTAVRNMALGVSSFMSLPVWATAWNSQTLPQASMGWSSSQEALLAEVVETIIPTTNTPGAKALNVHQFVQKVISDCYDKTTQANFNKGLENLESWSQAKYGKNFATCDTQQRIEALKNANSSFIGLAKWLTIKGYTNSEYVMTNLTHYEFVPGRFKGCVPIK